MIKIKVSCNFPTYAFTRQISPVIDKTKYEFYVNQDIDECDFWFYYSKGVKNCEETLVSKDNMYMITGEPESVYHYSPRFVKQFDNVITSRNDISAHNIIRNHPAQPWWVGRRNGFDANNENDFTLDYQQIKNLTISKSKELVLITSDKCFTLGHIKRYLFAKRLKKIFGDRLDIYGRGFNHFDDKWDLLKDYKYHIVIENDAQDDYWTEKLSDAYLAECFPLYHGAQNIDKYFSKKSFLSIDINNFEKSIKVIEYALQNKLYEENYEEIRNSKSQIMDNYNIVNEIINICNNKSISQYPKVLNKVYKDRSFFDYKKYILFLQRKYYLVRAYFEKKYYKYN